MSSDAANSVSSPPIMSFTDFYNITLEHIDFMEDYRTWQNYGNSNRSVMFFLYTLNCMNFPSGSILLNPDACIISKSKTHILQLGLFSFSQYWANYLPRNLAEHDFQFNRKICVHLNRSLEHQGDRIHFTSFESFYNLTIIKF